MSETLWGRRRFGKSLRKDGSPSELLIACRRGHFETAESAEEEEFAERWIRI
jgi:hypothetical protein